MNKKEKLKKYIKENWLLWFFLVISISITIFSCCNPKYRSNNKLVESELKQTQVKRKLNGTIEDGNPYGTTLNFDNNILQRTLGQQGNFMGLEFQNNVLTTTYKGKPTDNSAVFIDEKYFLLTQGTYTLTNYGSANNSNFYVFLDGVPGASTSNVNVNQGVTFTINEAKRTRICFAIIGKQNYNVNGYFMTMLNYGNTKLPYECDVYDSWVPYESGSEAIINALQVELSNTQTQYNQQIKNLEMQIANNDITITQLQTTIDNFNDNYSISEDLFNLMDKPILMLQQILNWDLLGINLWGLLSAIITLLLGVWIIRRLI